MACWLARPRRSGATIITDAGRKSAPCWRPRGQRDLSPFLATLEPGNVHRIYHAPELNETEQALSPQVPRERDQVDLADLATLPADAEITSISALGPREAVDRLAAVVAPFPELVAYAGDAFEGPGLGWIDIHHGAGTKGAAVEALKAMLNVKRLVVFGDG